MEEGRTHEAQPRIEAGTRGRAADVSLVHHPHDGMT